MNDELKAAISTVLGKPTIATKYDQAAHVIAQHLRERLAADEANSERLAVPRGRLMAWIRNYGDQKQPEFIADLKAVLGMEDGA